MYTVITVQRNDTFILEKGIETYIVKISPIVCNIVSKMNHSSLLQAR